MRIGGIVSTDGLDRQGERVVQDGLDFTPFLRHGWFNDNHGSKTTDVLGYPTGVRRVRKGEPLPNGEVSPTNGWWAEGYLLNTNDGRRVWELAQSLSDNPDRRLGFSIEGKVVARDRKDSSKIVSAVVNHVAITHCPVNTDTSLTSLAKALMAGGSIASPGATAGEGFALRTESLDRKRRKTDNEEDEDDVTVTHLSAGDGGQADNGGFGGVSPHTVRKAESSEPEPVSTFDFVSQWTDAFDEFRRVSVAEPVHLTKAEAQVIVSRVARHRLSDEALSQILKAGGFR
jgi:hypothetical protein